MNPNSPTPVRADLRLEITSTAAGEWIVTLWGGAGEELVRVAVPIFDTADFPGRLMTTLGRLHDAPLSTDHWKESGEVLAGRLLPPSVLAALESVLRTRPVEETVCLYLCFGTPELAEQPWEFVYNAPVPSTPLLSGFLALHPRLRLVREITPLPEGYRSAIGSEVVSGVSLAENTSQWRILIASANPGSPRFPFLTQADREWESLLMLLQKGSPRLRAQPILLSDATPASLLRRVTEQTVHVAHVIAHTDCTATGMRLALQGERPGTEAFLYVEDLANALRDAPPHLVFLSTCGSPAGARLAAEALCRAGVAYVIATQTPLRDVAARLFARSFYTAFWETGDVIESLWEARQTIQGLGPDWGNTVLYQATRSINTRSDVPILRASGGATPTLPRHNLPIFERRFIGRDADVSMLCDRLTGRGERLVTVTGIGGLGKTTLALRCASLLTAHFPDGVWLVELDALNGRQEIISAIYEALPSAAQGRAGTAGAVTLTALSDAIGVRRLLLVLDCFEQNRDEAGIIEFLLRHCPALSILVTSRIILGIPWEFEHTLQPLTIPAESTDSKSAPQKGSEGHNDGEALSESVSLFTDVVRQVEADFHIDGVNRPTIEEICRRLEGVPLSLILAAARLRYLTPEELLVQIRERPLQILRRRGIATDRHAALQEVIAGSFQLLDQDQRQLLRQLSVFQGGFYLKDADAVCLLPLSNDLVDCIGSLREHSLLSCAARGGQTRYRLLDTIREYVGGIADEESLAPYRERHADHYCRFAQNLNRRWQENDRASLTADLLAEVGNLRTAITWCSEPEGRRDLLLSFADSLARLFIEAGLWDDFDRMAVAALQAHEEADAPEAFLRLLAYRAQIARRRGAEAEARQLMERWLALCRSRQDSRGASDALFELASQARDQGEAKRAVELLAEVRMVASAAGIRGTTANACAVLAGLLRQQGQPEEACGLAEEAQVLLAAGVPADDVLFCSIELGRFWRAVGDAIRAESLLRQAVERAVDGARTFSISRALLELGPLYTDVGAWGQAARCFYVADAIHNHLDARRRELAKAALALFRRTHGGRPEVQAAFREVRRRPWNDAVGRILLEAPLTPDP